MPRNSDSRRRSSNRPAAFDALLERHLPELRRFVRPRLGWRIRARESSGDVVQSICRNLLDDARGYEERGENGFRRWLFRRAERKIVDKGRFYGRERRDVRVERGLSACTDGSTPRGARAPACASPSGVAIAREEHRLLEAALRELPSDYREVLVLARLEGLPHAAIARRLGRSEGAVRKLLSRAMARLATVMDAAEGAPSRRGG